MPEGMRLRRTVMTRLVRLSGLSASRHGRTREQSGPGTENPGAWIRAGRDSETTEHALQDMYSSHMTFS